MLIWKEKFIHQENGIRNPEISIGTTENANDPLFTEANSQQQNGI
jgi:hypothetical protein